MKYFWLASSLVVGLFWGCLVGLITTSAVTGVIFFFVGMFTNFMAGGMCIAASQGDKNEKLRI